MKNSIQNHKLGKVPEASSKISISESVIKENIPEAMHTLVVDDISERSDQEMSHQERLA